MIHQENLLPHEIVALARIDALAAQVTHHAMQTLREHWPDLADLYEKHKLYIEKIAAIH